MIKKILLWIFVIMTILVTLLFWLTSGLVDTANSFFNDLQQKNYKDAYQQYTSQTFKNSMNFDQFKEFIEKTKLDEITDENWIERETKNSFGKIKGTITLQNGEKKPIIIFFKKVNEEWKIEKISTDISNFMKSEEDNNIPSLSISMPNNKELITLVKNDIKIFTESIQNNNMNLLYNHISKNWQKTITPEDFRKSFLPLIEYAKKGLNFTLLNQQTPIIENKKLDKLNIMEIKVLYKGMPLGLNENLEFDLKYINENKEWKLIGIFLKATNNDK